MTDIKCPHCRKIIISTDDLEILSLMPIRRRILTTMITASPSALSYRNFGLRASTFSTHIQRIREALRDTGSPWYIDLSPGAGYIAKRVKRCQK